MGWSGFKEFKDKAHPIICVPRRWTTLMTWQPGEIDPLGTSAMENELYILLPAKLPKNMSARWLRVNDPDDPVDDDVTKRSTLAVGTDRNWAGVIVGFEDINATDLPMRLRFYHDGGGNAKAYTIVSKVGRFA
jgi:hypothetical protein